MALHAHSKKPPSLAAIDIILSCTVCHEPFPAIYAHNGDNRGLRRGDDAQDGRVTRLWLTECCHLSCAKHFEGGGKLDRDAGQEQRRMSFDHLSGVPFHSDQQTPSAPCPLCVTEKNDRSDKALFYINGTAKGEYDSNIPDSYFQTPPVALGGSAPGLDALLFQYLSLIRFGSRIHESALQLRNALSRWEERKPEIVQSLSNIAPLRDELLAAGRKLLALGQDVTSIEAVLTSAGANLTHNVQRQLDEHQLQRKLAPGGITTPSRTLADIGSRLARGSAADLDRLTKGVETPVTPERALQRSQPSKDGPSAKRKRESPPCDIHQGLGNKVESRRYEKGHSRDLMPPPPLPEQQFVFVGRVLTPDLEDRLDVPQITQFPTFAPGPSPTTPQRQTIQAQSTRVPVHTTNGFHHRSSVGSIAEAHRRRPNQRSSLPSMNSGGETSKPYPNHRSSLASLSSSEEATPRRLDVNTTRSMQLPAQFDGRTISIEDLSSQAITSASSSYRDRFLPIARPSSEALPHHLRIARRPVADPPPGRLTLTPRYGSQHRRGLSANARTSNDRLGTAASPHFNTRIHPYSSSLPHDNSQVFGEAISHIGSFDPAPTPGAKIRYMNSFDSGPTAINGGMRPYSSTTLVPPNNFLLAQDPASEEARRRREEALSALPSFAERMQRAQAERGRGGPITPAIASYRSNSNYTAAHGSSNLIDPRDSAPASRSGRRPAHR